LKGKESYLGQDLCVIVD